MHTSTMASPDTSADELIARYDTFLLDAYGVLVTTRGAIDGAKAFLDRLNREGKPWLIVSNDASRSIATTVDRYRAFGLPVDADHILTSGALLPAYFARERLAGRRCVVLGTPESGDYVRLAGGVVTDPADDDASVCVVCGVYDAPAAPFLDRVNQVISLLLRRLERGAETRIVVPNPDVIYPSDTGAFAFTAGGLAALLAAVVELRDRDGACRFDLLGKPHAWMFDAALDRLGRPDRRRTVMVGDQLVTDILGAQRAGIDSVLIETGVSRRADLARAPAAPTWLLADLVARAER